MTQTPLLSVVIGSRNSAATIRDVLRTLGNSPDVQIIVADASDDGTAEIIEGEFGSVELIRRDRKQLIPHLWGAAIERARAPLIAITNAHCVPDARWITSILEAAAERPDAAAIGGPIEPPEGSAAIDFAVYLSRYSSYMPPVPAAAVVEIPGDNAVYRTKDLEAAWVHRGDGFWETLVHVELRKLGRNITMDDRIRVRSGSGHAGGDFASSRFQHGRHYGSTRPMAGLRERLVRIAAAPVLPLILLLRIGRRVMQRQPRMLWRYLRVLPWLTLFIGAWTAGEISGYVAPPVR